MARLPQKFAGVRGVPILVCMLLLMGTFFLQAQTPAAKSKPVKPSASPKANAKSPERLQQLLDDVKRARQLLQEKSFEEFAEEYLPIEELRRIRSNTSIKQMASQLKSHEAASSKIQPLMLMLERAQTGTWEFSHDDSQVTMTFFLKDYQPKTKTQKTVATDPDAPGLGAELPHVFDEAIKLLEAKDYQNFVIKIFPLSEVQRYVAPKSEAEAELAVVLRDNPDMATAMLADLQALRKLKPKMDSGDGATFELPLTIKASEQVAPKTSPKGKPEEASATSRQIRFQKVRGHWRFYDHRAEMSKVISELDVNYDPDAPAPETISWERFGKHWRLKNQPGPSANIPQAPVEHPTGVPAVVPAPALPPSDRG